MNKKVLGFLLFLPLLAHAGAEEDMMAQIQEMQQCMQSIDRSEMEAMKVEGEKVSEELKSLCKAGKPDEAKEKAITYSKKMMDSNALKAMRKCVEKMPESMKGMMPPMGPEDMEKELKDKNICDNM